MQKLFSAVNRSPEYIGTTEIIRLMDRADAMSGNGQLMRDNFETLKKICVKIINLARKNEEWFAFFGCAKGFLWLLWVNNDMKMMIKCSELIEREKKVHFEETCMRYPKQKSNLYMWVSTFHYMEMVYFGMPQISDKRLEQYLQECEEHLRSIQIISRYLDRSLYMDLLSVPDMDQCGKKAEELVSILESSHPKESIGCYICNTHGLRCYYLKTKQYDLLDEHVNNILTRNIPKRFHNCYDDCCFGQDIGLVRQVLYRAIDFGCYDYFWKLIEEYRELFEDFAFDKENYSGTHLLFYLVLGIEIELDADVFQEAADITKDFRNFKYTYVNFIGDSTYLLLIFRLLQYLGKDRISVNEDIIETFHLEPGDYCDVSILEEHMEQEVEEAADIFCKSRKKYNYREMKENVLGLLDSFKERRGEN